MKIIKGKVNYLVTDNDEYIRIDSIDIVSINQPIIENDRCIVCVTVFGQDIGVTHFIGRAQAGKYRSDILNSMKKTDKKRMTRRFVDLFRRE